VGNAYPHKNLERLLLALAKITSRRKMFKNFSLVLVGEQDFFYKRLVNYVKELRLENKVIFWGKADRQELNTLYRNAIALVFPSLMEGFGLPGLEAMAAGCPVVCSDIPVLREVYSEAAIYFNPYDPADMAEKMSDVLNNPQKYAKFKTLGSELVKGYSWQQMAKQTLEIYRSIR
jgi:glycosyltransferase involved in cell wall biosynthesis